MGTGGGLGGLVGLERQHTHVWSFLGLVRPQVRLMSLSQDVRGRIGSPSVHQTWR